MWATLTVAVTLWGRIPGFIAVFLESGIFYYVNTFFFPPSGFIIHCMRSFRVIYQLHPSRPIIIVYTKQEIWHMSQNIILSFKRFSEDYASKLNHDVNFD